MGKLYGSALVTGGAGFIGTRTLPLLAPLCDRIAVFDCLHTQVHGTDPAPPALAPGDLFVRGDMRDRDAVEAVVAATRPDLVVHLAAETGTGQSYDEVARYCDANVQGTAYLVEAVRRLPAGVRPRRLVLASSRAVYGEGAYRDAAGAMVVPPPRRAEDMAAGRFRPVDADGAPLTPVATPETTPPAPGSVYASTKLMQELLVGQGFAGGGAEPVVLRFQNVYGPGQSLRNPYTGVLTIFGRIALAGGAIDIFEDGDIVRDFVAVEDVARAIALAAAHPSPPRTPVNIGSGEAVTIRDAARALLAALGRPDRHAVSGRYRIGDVRHAVADIAQAAALLDWRPQRPFADGIAALAAWIAAEAGAAEPA